MGILNPKTLEKMSWFSWRRRDEEEEDGGENGDFEEEDGEEEDSGQEDSGQEPRVWNGDFEEKSRETDEMGILKWMRQTCLFLFSVLGSIHVFNFFAT